VFMSASAGLWLLRSLTPLILTRIKCKRRVDGG
jgi:hypothetical protein